MLIYYAHTYTNATIRYHASDMCLHIDSDAAYLVHPKSRCQVTGHHYLSIDIPAKIPTPNQTPNGAILTECETIRNVMSSAVEAEIIGIFHNAKVAVPIHTNLNELGHIQPPATIQTESSTSHGILTSTIRQKRSKAFDMNIYWINNRIKWGQFYLSWDRDKNNKADYFPK